MNWSRLWQWILGLFAIVGAVQTAVTVSDRWHQPTTELTGWLEYGQYAFPHGASEDFRRIVFDLNDKYAYFDSRVAEAKAEVQALKTHTKRPSPSDTALDLEFAENRLSDAEGVARGIGIATQLVHERSFLNRYARLGGWIRIKLTNTGTAQVTNVRVKWPQAEFVGVKQGDTYKWLVDRNTQTVRLDSLDRTESAYLTAWLSSSPSKWDIEAVQVFHDGGETEMHVRRPVGWWGLLADEYVNGGTIVGLVLYFVALAAYKLRQDYLRSVRKQHPAASASVPPAQPPPDQSSTTS